MAALDYDYIFKLVVVGESGVGKRYADDSFSEVFISTIGVDFKLKTINLQSKKIKLQIWDTAGQERFKTITTSYYRGANGIVVCYDITDRSTFAKLDTWLNEVKRYAVEGAPVLLCGLKADLEQYRVVTTKEGQDFANKYNMSFLETSAKKNTRVDEAFEKLAEQILSHQRRFAVHDTTKKPDLIHEKKPSSGGCLC